MLTKSVCSSHLTAQVNCEQTFKNTWKEYIVWKDCVQKTYQWPLCPFVWIQFLCCVKCHCVRMNVKQSVCKNSRNYLKVLLKFAEQLNST